MTQKLASLLQFSSETLIPELILFPCEENVSFTEQLLLFLE